ncbi:BN860_04764g1_1 [Zygosaccharomyces bailii CLIB 213]|uniref:BN860_04764g1_1 n=1 Tax=Zygosaccharomyces bailii (strain CLIB 213 / ATCC 58445 / CBS 680 / BCRC 21525 / NBRC 1098 / NCYC 1416 / NRRL Y-2227) TaxID=1333698 RepID=A0A8J2T232_ZYGB2|nr:BN860_04764g1_1 [Zygosaccharomyces bailii CLIB 213]
MRSSSFVSSTTSKMGSASTSTSSLFSLDKSTYSALWQNRANYYYHHEEIDESDHGVEDLDRTTSHSPLTFEFGTRLHKEAKFVFVLVGLPAVGKSSTSEHLVEFFKGQPATKNLRCSIYNAGKVRRSMSFQNLGLLSMQLANNSSEDLFSPKNYNKKEMYAKITLEKLLNDLDSDSCDVAIFDATNSRVNRRRFVFDEICSYNQKRNTRFCITPIVLQISCSDHDFIKFNVHNKSFNADYFDKPYEYAVRDFAKRMRNYHSQFTPFTEEEFRQVSKLVKAHGLDYGVFFFNIVNAGMIPTGEQNLGVLPVQRGRVQTVVSLVGQFVEHYTKMFGHSYVERVVEFFNNEAAGGSQYMSVLNDVINQEFLEELQGSLECNVKAN